MSKSRAIVLTVCQVLFGGVLGLIGGGLCFIIFNPLGRWLASVISGGIFYAIPLLLLFLIAYGVTIVCVGEGVRLITYRMRGTVLSRKSVYQGAFLGIPAAAALLSMATYDWSSMDAGMFQSKFIMGIVQVIAIIVSTPVRLLLILRIPPELLYFVSAPIGAIIGYRIAKPEYSANEEAKSESQ